MAKYPNPQSRQQILGDMLATYMAKIGVNDLNVGGAVTSFFEAMAQAVYRASGDTFAILRDFSVDRAEGEALKRLAEEERVYPIPARVATGRVTITDTSFEKLNTKIYAGSPPPNIGSTELPVSDTEGWPTSGAIYIGRGTPNIEGPIAYSSITDLGSYSIINLDTPTTKYHNNNESVILSQGGVRNIPIGTGVRTVGGGSSPTVSFTTTQAAVILDGETEVTNVPVAAQQPGISGNVPRNAIKEFISSPFSGATVTNPSPFTTGRNEESDEEIRTRIKKARISKGLGTAVAVQSSVLGAQASDENAIVTSNQILSTGDKTTLFIDNGQGYEGKTSGVGLEFILDPALGGEQFFQLATGGSQTSIAKAFLVSSEQAPFKVSGNDRLAVLVGGILSEHVFQSTDFRAEGAADAFEIVSSINGNADLKFSARTSDNGTKVKLEAKDETNEYLQITTPTSGNDAGLAMGFPVDEVQTLKLFKNRTELSRNGRSAVIESENQNDWSDTISGGETLILAVDGTAQIVYTFLDSDFIAEGTHTTVSKNNSLQSWVNVINAKVTGVTASINGNRLVLTSNLGTSSRASLAIDLASTLVSKGVFSVGNGLSSTGKESDYTLSRNTGQIKLTSPLEAGDSLSAGIQNTEATIESGQILGGSVTLATDADMWFLVDNQDAAVVQHGVLSDSFLTITKQPSNVVRVRSNLVNAFANVQAGDYVVFWSDEVLGVNRFEARVYSVGTELQANDYFEVKLTSAEYVAATAEGPIVFLEGLNFIRTDIPPQRARIVAGSYQISEVANTLESQLLGVDTSTENDEIILVSSTNKTTNGSIRLFTQNDSAKNLNFTDGDYAESNTSLTAHVLTAEESYPLFIHSSFAADRNADLPTSTIADVESAIDLASAGVNPDAYLAVQHPYLNGGSYILDAQPADEKVLIDSISGTTVDIDDSLTIKRIRTNDRYYLLRTLDIGYNDTMTVIFDSDTVNKTFPVKLYRRAIANSTMPIDSDEFRAYDVDAGATTEFSQFFGNSFEFKNYRAYMQARNVIDPLSATDEDAILFKSAVWGSAGEQYRVGYFYPTASDQGIEHTVSIGEYVDINLFLKSGAAVPNSIDGTTEWDVTITPNTPVAGVDEVTYSWNTTGADPTMNTLAPGHYVTINNNGEFSAENTGTFRISAANATSFTVRRPNGAAVAENNIATLTTTTISLYENSDTTAQEVVDYVTNNLTNFITASIVDDNGDTGAGIFGLSTYEDSSFTSQRKQLVDGLNWISVSDLDAAAPNAQFTLKKTLDLPTFSTNTADAYSFNDGEEVRLVPTSIDQIQKLMSVLAVTGLTTLGGVTTTERQDQLQISTDTLGSDGAVLISGGTGNNAQAQVVGVTQQTLDSGYIRTTISNAGLGGFSGGSLVKLQASNTQRKVTGISFTTNATVTPNEPDPATSIVELGNRDISDRYFGEPRNNVRTRGRAFHVEKHGALVCIAWDGATGADPLFAKSVEINDDGGNLSVAYNDDFILTEYTVQSGTRNFCEVNVGDLMTIDGFANAANNGTFKVRGVSSDGLTVSVENTDGVDEVSTAIATLSFATEIKEGDTVEIGSPFTSLNQGQFRVVRRYNNSIYIENDLAVEERVLIVDNLRNLGFDATTEFNITVPGNMRIEWNTNGTEPSLENARMGDVLKLGASFAANNQGEFTIVDSGDNYIEVKNALAVAESGVTVNGVGANVLECQISAMKFSEYEATVPGDTLVISGNVLGSNNQGEFVITEVLSKNKIAVDDVMETVSPAQQLNELFNQVYVREGTPYSGYKEIHTIASNPANSLQSLIVFNTEEQFNKINASGSIVMTVAGKTEFPEVTYAGADSYKYHTGLLAEANRVVYGDPRDTTTYPGVAAAGAEIFIEEPLVKRIKVSVNVRLNTGTPFGRVTEEVRNAIAALINSSPIGESIAISDVVSQVNSVKGVRAVSISSPAYDAANDVIVVNPAEKPYILDIINDVVVSKIE